MNSALLTVGFSVEQNAVDLREAVYAGVEDLCKLQKLL
jgi:hypothetical protein